MRVPLAPRSGVAIRISAECRAPLYEPSLNKQSYSYKTQTSSFGLRSWIVWDGGQTHRSLDASRPQPAALVLVRETQ